MRAIDKLKSLVASKNESNVDPLLLGNANIAPVSEDDIAALMMGAPSSAPNTDDLPLVRPGQPQSRTSAAPLAPAMSAPSPVAPTLAAAKSAPADTPKADISAKTAPIPETKIETQIETTVEAVSEQAATAVDSLTPYASMSEPELDAELETLMSGSVAAPIAQPQIQPQSQIPATAPPAPQTIAAQSRPESPMITPSLGHTRQLGTPRKTESLSHIRKDLAQLNSDMSSGEQFYAQSLKRISNLIDYAYETEANLSALEQLEPENLRLKTALHAAKQKITDETVRAESLKSKADAYEARYLETRQGLETAQLTLTQLEADRAALTRTVADKENEIANLSNHYRTLKNAHAVDQKTQQQTTAKVLKLSSDLSVALSEKLELEKRSQDLTARYDALMSDKQTLERMVTQTRNAQRQTEDHNLALKTELEQVLADVKIFKQQFDAATRNQDAEITLLRGNVDTLESELSIKTGVVTHAQQEMTDLREKFDTAHRGRRKLLEHIETQKREYDDLRVSLDNSRNEVKAFAGKLGASQTEIDQLRRVNALQSEKLKRYSALNSTQISTPAYPSRDSAPRPRIYGDTSRFERRSPNRPFQSAAPQAAVTAHIADAPLRADLTSEQDAMHRATIETPAQAPTQAHMAAQTPEAFDREFASLEAMAPLGPQMSTPAMNPAVESVSEEPMQAPVSPPPQAPVPAPPETRSESQQIEDALLGMHDVDLLAQYAG